MIRNRVITKDNDLDWHSMRLLHFACKSEQRRKRISPEQADDDSTRIMPALLGAHQ